MTALLESSPAGAAQCVEAGAGDGRTILVAEDLEVLRRMTCEFLKLQGYRVLEAADGVEALQKARAYDGQIDILLTDVCMPRMGAVELASELRVGHPGIRVLYTSGYEEQVLKEEGQTESDAFLPKPFTPSVLLGALRNLSI